MGNSLKQTRALIFICLWVIFVLLQKKYIRVLDVYYMEGEFSADDWTKDGKHKKDHKLTSFESLKLQSFISKALPLHD